MENTVECLPDYIIDRARKLNTTLLSDAMNRTGTMNYKIKPVDNEMKVAGTAITVSLRSGDNLFLHEAIYLGSAGYILVVDGQGNTENAYLGDLMANAAKAMQIEGIVIDGLVRDKMDLIKLGLPIFCKGFISNGPFKEGPGQLNTIISCGGRTVSPGDLIVGDADGVVVIPRNNIKEVLEKAEQKLQYEKKRLEKIEQFKKDSNRDLSIIKPKWLDGK